MNKETSILIQKLPISTAECDYGPQINFTVGECTLKYDYESDSGIKWVTIVWNTALAVKTTPDKATSLLQSSAYSKICKIQNSLWLKSLITESKGNDGELPKGLIHYLIFFDHECSIEIIAKSFKIIM